MQASSVIGLGVVVLALGTAAALYIWSVRRIRFIHQHHLVRLRQILKELQHGP